MSYHVKTTLCHDIMAALLPSNENVGGGGLTRHCVLSCPFMCLSEPSLMVNWCHFTVVAKEPLTSLQFQPSCANNLSPAIYFLVRCVT